MSFPFADLHLHSYFSDGTLSPGEIISLAKEKGIGTLSICDHECTESYPLFLSLCQKAGVHAFTGVELTSRYEGNIYHVLGYGFDPSYPPLKALIDANRQTLLKMSDDLIQRMEKEYPTLCVEEHKRYTYDPAQGGWKTLYYLMEKGVTSHKLEALPLYARYGCNYIDAGFPTVREVCTQIKAAGGYAVLAHCGDSVPHKGDLALLEKTVFSLLTQGIQGLECYYPSHTKEITALCLSICNAQNLFITAGSDSHGEFQKWVGDVPFAMGSILVEREKLRLGRLL